MMERENPNRTRRTTLRLTPEEYTKIEKRYKASTCRKLSDYVRKHLFNRPITTHYRNQSLDDFIEEMALLRNELSAIGNNINQVVKKMHTLNQIPEFKQWIIRYEIEQQLFKRKIDLIEKHISKITDKWFQS